MTLLPIIGAVGALLGLLALVAAAFVVVKSSATKAAAEAWKGEADAHKARGDRLEKDITDLKATVEALKVQIDALTQDNKRLQDLATGATAIRELTELVRAQHQETLYLIGAVTTAPTKRKERDDDGTAAA